MTPFLLFVVWGTLALAAYAYFLYPAVLFLLTRGRPRELPQPLLTSSAPFVSMVICAYNEEEVIGGKVDNALATSYPSGRFEILVGSDGSTDRTNEILSARSHPALHVWIFPGRRGKASVLNDLVREARGEIVIFSDANTVYAPDAMEKLAAGFAKPRVGAVVGELVLRTVATPSSDVPEIGYWSIENRIKAMESSLGTTVGGTGPIYAIRSSLFRPLDTTKPVVDDLVIPLEIIRRGFAVSYAPTALAFETTHETVKREFWRKTRIAAGNFHALSHSLDLLRPRYGFGAIAFFSHKVLRWILPFLLLAALSASGFLAADAVLYRFILGCAALFFAAALAGFVSERTKLHIRILALPYYFTAMNLALLVGFLKFLFNRQKPTWEMLRDEGAGSARP